MVVLVNVGLVVIVCGLLVWVVLYVGMDVEILLLFDEVL